MINSSEISSNKIYVCFDEMLNKGSIQIFKNYIKRTSNKLGWGIVSDYCIDSEEKINNCWAFSIFPCDANLYNIIQEEIKINIKKDIKHTKNIQVKAKSFLKNNPYFFNFIFIVEDYENINYDGQNIKNTKEVTQIVMDYLLNAGFINSSCIKKIKKLRQETNRKSFNIKLFSQVTVTALFAAYLNTLILRESSIDDIISWLPDRGPLNNSFDGILYDLYQLNCEGLKEYYGIKKKQPELICIEENNKIFFDEFIKIPDYFAGTLASWDYKNKKKDINQKHKEMVEEVIADNQNLIMIDVKFTNKTPQSAILKCTKSK